MKKKGTLTRRDFISWLQAAGLAVPFSGYINLAGTSGKSITPQLQNDYFSITFDTRSGSLDIRRRSGELLLSRSVIRVVAGQLVFSTNHSSFRHTLEIRRIKDIFGEGQQLLIRSYGSVWKIDLELKISIYNRLHGVIIESNCLNATKETVLLQRIETICATNETGGALYWPKTSKLLTDGPMYYDPGAVYDFGLTDNNLRQSWWNIGLFSGYEQEGLVIGAVENMVAQGKLSVKRGAGEAIDLVAQSAIADGFILYPGKTVRSNRFMLNIGRDPYTALEDFADVMGRMNKARVNSIINGWCSWFYTYEHVTEDEVIRNAEFAARVLKPYGLEYIQVDEGYQRWHGEWDGNDRFRHGMKWLADRIHGLGLKPGLWIAPYVISEPTEIFREHKDWLIKHPDGSLKRVGPWPDENSDWANSEKPKRFGLDVTHPAASEWLFNLFDKVSKQWGYEMIKIDFVDWSLLSAHHYYDPAISRAMAYRKGFEIMRKAIGNDCHLQDCGPGPITVGLLDSMRIELDQNYGYGEEVWKTYFTTSSSSAPAAAKRYYFHKRTWINDADHLCMSLLSLTRAQAAATLLALTGGNIISGDRLPDLDPVKLEILKKTYPSWGEAARPVDLFDTDLHRIFAMKIKKSFAEWTIAGFFNSNDTRIQEYTLPLNRLWLDNSKNYIVYDFWNNRFFGEISKELKVQVSPSSVLLLSLREKSGNPEVLSTDRHILQGAVEVEDVYWDPVKQVLIGTSLGALHSAYNVYVFVPDQHSWRQGGSALYSDFENYTLKMTDNNILRIHVRFDRGSRVSWTVNFPEFFRMDK